MSANAVAWTAAVACGLGTAAVVFRLGGLRADEAPEPAGIPARLPERQAALEDLARLLRDSHEVLGIVPPGATPFTEIVLWYDDVNEDDRIDAGEILLLAHSPHMRSISLYRYPADEARHAPPSLQGAGTASFCRRFRGHPDVQQWTFGKDAGARDISDLRVDPVGSLDEGGALVRITLTWADDPVDGPDTASVVADVRLRRSDD